MITLSDARRAFSEAKRALSEAAIDALARVLVRLRPLLAGAPTKRGDVVLLNNSYYHFLFLARELRKRGWGAWAVDTDPRQPGDPFAGALYHGADIYLHHDNRFRWRVRARRLFLEIQQRRAVLIFYGLGRTHIDPDRGGLAPGPDGRLEERFMLEAPAVEFELLRRSGVRLGYCVAGCSDGVTGAQWNAWTGGMCEHCRFRNTPLVCTDQRNAAWGRYLLENCDVIFAELMPRLGALTDAKVVATPTTYCVDPDLWTPSLAPPDRLRLAPRQPGEVIIMHAVGNMAWRTLDGADPKGTKAIVAAAARLQAEGLPVRLELVQGVPSVDMRYYLTQADIIVDQLRFGRYGALGRESLMLGKPVVGYLKRRREEEDDDAWACLQECPIVDATPETIEDVLRRLALSPDLRQTLAAQSRAFALKWHSPAACADRFEKVMNERFGL